MQPSYRVSGSEPSESAQALHWTVALAGGDGEHLQSYIQRRFGQAIPKQYCPLLGSRSMLEHTLGRLNQLTPASRTLTVIGTAHEPYAVPQLSGLSDHVLCQPASRDTGIALYVMIAMIKRWTPNATVTITPTDHYVAPTARYLDHLQMARSVASRMRGLIMVLGARPTEPDPDFSYLRLGQQLTDIPQASRIIGIVEPPSVREAQALIAAGALWSTMVACASVDALWALGRATEPRLMDLLDCLVPLVGTPDESQAIEYIYRTHPPVSFSSNMLALAPRRLAVIELAGVEWSDWGRPERIETVLALRRSRARS